MQLLKPGWQVSAVTQWGSAKVSAPTVTFVCVLRTLSPTPPQTSPWCARSETVGGVHICQKESNSILLSMTGFPCGSVVKNPPANAGDVSSVPGSGRCPGEGNGNPLRYSWNIPWTEEPDGLQSMELQRVGGSLATEHTILCYDLYYLIPSYYYCYFNIIPKESLHFHIEWAHTE